MADFPELRTIFEQVQTTSANHQKNWVALSKLQSAAAQATEAHGRSIRRVGERAFEDAVLSLLARVLPVKKGAPVADRVLRFVGGFVRFILAKAKEEPHDGEDDSTAARFVARLLRFLFRGTLAKDKTARFRAVQAIAELVVHLAEIDEDVYHNLKECLLDRVRDKEAPVRLHAVVALSKLCGSEDPSEQPNITDILLDTLCGDPSSDVRRAALLNLPLGPRTIPALLSRSRDVDPLLRRLLYATVLDKNCSVPDDAEHLIGPAHPRALTIAQRELVTRNGLGDRDPAVRAAATKLLSAWLHAARPPAQRLEDQDDEADLIAFLHLFDLVESTTAEDALTSLFKTNPKLLDKLSFDDAYWQALTPEKAFLARVFVDHCVASKHDARLEASLPVVTLIAFRIQETWADIRSAIDADEEAALLRGDIDDHERARREEARLDHEFVIAEMLRIAVNVDYADEVGRRKMRLLVRNMICDPTLPEGVIARSLDVLRRLSLNERDLIREVVEVVHEIRDPADEDDGVAVADDSTVADTPATVKTVRAAAPKPVAQMTPEAQARADAVDMRCLTLCIGMLERVNSTFEDNVTLEGLLRELIVPAVKRKELALRERGLVSLGLCCLIARTMAQNSFQLFLSQVQAAPPPLKVTVLQVVFDVLMVHEGVFLGKGCANGERIVEFLLHVLDNEESDAAQAVLCVGISKLMLAGMISDDRVLQRLVLTYVSPATAHNQALRQCLAYFFPVYCYSAAANQRRMQRAFTPLYEKLRAEWDGDADTVSPAQASLMLVDWTDPQKARAVAATVQGGGPEVDEAVHVDLAGDVVRVLFSDDLSKDDRKALCQLLGKLYLPETVDDDKIRTLKLLMHNLHTRRPLKDTAAKNAFAKFESALTRRYAAQLADFDEDDYRRLEYLQDMFAFLDAVGPEHDDDDEDGGGGEEEGEEAPRKAGRKRRSGSVTTDTSVSGEDDTPPPPPARGKGKGKGNKAKRPRLSGSDAESFASRDSLPAPAPAPSRVVPRRSAAEKSRAAVSRSLAPVVVSGSEEDGEEEEEDEDEDEASFEPKDKGKGKETGRGRGRGRGEVRGIRAAARRVPALEAREDSIMDSSSEGEEGSEDEVAELI